MTQKKIEQMYNALRRITMYDNPARLKKTSGARYGLPDFEAIEYAYENVLAEARVGLRGVRMPKRPASENDNPSAPSTSPDGEQKGADKAQERGGRP